MERVTWIFCVIQFVVGIESIGLQIKSKPPNYDGENPSILTVSSALNTETQGTFDNHHRFLHWLNDNLPSGKPSSPDLPVIADTPRGLDLPDEPELCLQSNEDINCHRSRKLRSAYQQEPPSVSEEAQKTIDLLKQGESEVELDYNGRDAVLVLGARDSAKITFVRWVAERDENLESRELSPGSGKFTVIESLGVDGQFRATAVVPKRVVNTKTNTLFYDCPSDSSDLAHGITSAYFTKVVADNAGRVKLILVANYSSLSKSFMTLVKDAIVMVKDVDKFKDGIAFVVTEVDNHYTSEGSLVSDKEIIADVANFLKAVREQILAKSSENSAAPESRQLYLKAVKFIDVLLEEKSGDYSKISIFRRPDKPGPLGGIALLQNGRKSVEKKLLNFTQYVGKNRDDFVYVVSLGSQNHSYAVIESIANNIVPKIFNISQEIRKNLFTQEKSLNDIEGLCYKFNVTLDTLLTLRKKVNRPQDFVEFARKLNDLGIKISGDNLSNLANYERYLIFLAELSGQKTRQSSDWLRELTNFVEYLTGSQYWYNFLLKLYSALAEYKVQGYMKEYINTATSLIEQLEYADNRELVTTALKKLLDKVMPLDSWEEYNKIKSVDLNEAKLRKLKLVIEVAFKSVTTTSRGKDDSLTIKGRFVQVGDVIPLIDDNVKFVEILALDTVFIDEDLSLHTVAELSIVAPTWHFRRSDIDLSGYSASSHLPWTARSGDSGEGGSDGLPGKPGNPAGKLFGIGRTFKNPEFVRVVLNGGRGGVGQNGGDGADGTGGTKPRDREGTHNDWDRVLDDPATDDWNCEDASGFWEGLKGDEYCTFQGKDCTSGSDGGDGGRGGRGGAAGEILLVALDGDDPEISVERRSGPDGEGGNGGRGGKAGKSGTSETYKKSRGNRYTWKKTEYLSSCFAGDDGSYGGASELSPEVSQDAGAVKFRRARTALYNFKSYAEEDVTRSVKASELRRFLDDLEKHELVSNL